MSSDVLVCGSIPVPLPLAELTVSHADPTPTADQVEAALKTLWSESGSRLIVVGRDAAFAAVLSYLLQIDRLDVELAFVSDEDTQGTVNYHLATGVAGARDAVAGDAHALPLIRDDVGVALVGEAVYSGQDGAPLEGEMYIDDQRLFTGSTQRVRVRPMPEFPGLEAAVDRRTRLLPRKWLQGRAAQLGSVAGHVVRDGVPDARVLKRSTFYRHEREFLLVR